MTSETVNIHVLDAAYVAFPAFKEWAERTTVDTVRWERYNSSLKDRASHFSPEVLARALNVAKRAAAVDTGAIEGLYEVDRGFTYTVALETATWEAALAQKGEYVRSLFEAQLHAYDYVLDLATKAQPISEAAIRALHEEVCRAQTTYRVMTAVGPQEQALPKGQYKALPNHVRTRKGTDHSYAPVDVTPAEMARLTNELRGAAFLTAHPVLQAAYAHYCVVVIHPFADGNGRVARALASAFTYGAISMPIVILSEHRDTYLTALESADAGDYQSFVDFMLARSLDTIALVNESLQSAHIPKAEQSVAAIEALYVTKGGYVHEQIDQAGQRLLEALQQAVNEVFTKIGTPKISRDTAIVSGGGYSPPSEYRFPIGGPQILRFILASQPPAQARVVRMYGLLLPMDAAGEDDVRLIRTNSSDPADSFIARVDELIPVASGVFGIRLAMFAERIASEMLAELKDLAERSMGKRP